MFQLQLQPTVSVMSSQTSTQSVPLTPNKAKQPPQLLPKPAVTVAKTLSVPASSTTVSRPLSQSCTNISARLRRDDRLADIIKVRVSILALQLS